MKGDFRMNSYNEFKNELVNKLAEEGTITEYEAEYLKEDTKEIKKEEKRENPETKFKILKKSVVYDIAGEQGTYHIENNKIGIEGKTFSTSKEIEEHFKEEKEILEEQLKKINMKQNEMIQALEFFKEV